MAKVCREVQDWIEEEIEKPIEEWVEKKEKKCKKKKCKKWCLCCNKWFCWIVTFLVKVVTWVIVTIGKWITRIVCEVIALVLDAIQFVVNRVLGLVDFVGSLMGIRPTKFIRLKIFILTDLKGRPIHNQAQVQIWLDETVSIFKDRLNIEVHPANLRSEDFINIIKEPAPGYAVFPDSCSVGNAYGDAAEYYESQMTYSRTSTTEFLQDLVGYGVPIFAFMVHSFSDGETVGCSYPIISDYALVARDAKTTSLAHEMCHLCGIFPHHDDSHNLMNSDRDDMDSELTSWQISVIRNSKYVTYLRT